MQTKDGQGDERTRKTFFAGDMTVGKSDLELRREQAQKQAMKVVSDTFDNEKKLDKDMEDRKLHMEELAEQNVALRKERKMVQDQLSTEGLSEESAYEFGEAVQEYNRRIAQNEAMIRGESMTIQATKLERLKSNPMGEATKAAEAINLAAAEEFACGLLNEAKESLEKKMEETKEQGEKLQEQLEEKQEALDESVEKRKERMEVLNEQIQENAKNINELAADLSKTQDGVNQQLEEIRHKMKMLEEDLKGAAMDEQW